VQDPSSKLKLNNVWFFRSLIMMAVLVFSLLLLFYSFIFLNTYLTLGNTTSYFPWGWQILYTAWGTVEYQFVEGVGISLATIGACSFALWFFFIPRVRIS
jgi:hypothetical protein